MKTVVQLCISSSGKICFQAWLLSKYQLFVEIVETISFTCKTYVNLVLNSKNSDYAFLTHAPLTVLFSGQCSNWSSFTTSEVEVGVTGALFSRICSSQR